MLIEKMNFIVKHSHFCHVTWIFTNPMLARESSWLEVERQCYHALGRTLIRSTSRDVTYRSFVYQGNQRVTIFPVKTIGSSVSKRAGQEIKAIDVDKVFFGKNGKFLSKGLLGTFYCNSWGGKGRINTNKQFRQARVKRDYIN